MTDRERLQHQCPACHALPGSPCVDPLGDATARPHRTRGAGELEPSAGTGNLIAAIREAEPTATITAVELVGTLAERLQRNFTENVTVRARVP